VAIPGLHQVGEERFGAVDDAPQIDTEHPFVVGVGVGVHGTALGYAGVVEHQVHGPEMAGGVRGPGCDLVTVGDVEDRGGDRDVGTVEEGCCVGEAGGIDVGQGQVGAGRGQAHSQGPPDPTSGPGAPGEVLHQCCSLSKPVVSAAEVERSSVR